MQDMMAVYEGEPSFSDPEDFVDDIEDELLSDLLQGTPLEVNGICVMVDNVPQVGPERLDKLKSYIHKIFTEFGDITTEFYPEADGMTKGYAFMEYATPAQALKAVQRGDGYQLDKQHTLRVTTVSGFDRCMNMSDDWEPPEEKPFKDVGSLHHWLLDPDCCDQYSVMYESGQKAAVFSNNATEPILVMERKEWRDTYMHWSPKGTYLQTFHQKGIALWGSEKLELIQRLNHQGVSRTHFSPCERYLVTYSPPMDTKEDPQTHKHIVIIWDIKSGQNKGFHCESCTHWPIFKWSHDGMFFTRMTQDELSIYETPSMDLLDKKSLKIIGIKDFSWSPRDNIVAFWVPEDKHISARTTLMQIPSRQEIRHHNLLFNLVTCEMHWQRNGDYLCVKVGRTPKGAQGVVTNFEIFRMRDKLAPVDVVEMKESVVAFALEPNGSRFAVVHAESPGRYNASIYHIKNNGKIELIKTFENQQVNSIFWSPQGRFLVLAGLRKKEEDEEYQGLKSMNGALAFLDTSDCTMMNTAEHYAATDVEWDPTGRYVVTSVSWWRHKVDNAYWLWTSQGRLLQKNNKERFCQLLWRPRPATLLSDEQIKAISKDMKRFSKVFEQKDRLSQSKASKELVDRRRAMVEKYRLYRQKVSQVYWEQRDLRLKLREGVDTELYGDMDDCEEETVEFVISDERIPV